MRFASVHRDPRHGIAVVLAFCGMVGLIAPAHAAFIVTYEQDGSNVVATGSGTLDTTDLVKGTGTYNSSPGVIPNTGFSISGPAVAVSDDEWFGISGPLSFGAGGVVAANAGSGDRVGVDLPQSELIVPHGYISGSLLFDTSIFTGWTLSGMGLTPGTYISTWGTGADADSFTVQIGLVPEPSSLLISALPLSLLLLRRRRAALAP